jgi:ubiquinone/menaquinone biosynthesis C-methylase UbiE
VSFKDYFSAQASDYSKFRPHYPDALFAYLASLCPNRRLTWDCGAGNGQASVELARYFGKVIATEPSEKQLALAEKHPKVEYRKARAEQSGLEDYSANLVAVAQAFHWFDQPAFFREVRRVAEPGGVLAVWCYELAVIDENVDSVVMRLYRDLLGAFWDPARRLIEEGYKNEKFPFNELTPPVFDMHADWDFSAMLGYLGTWSAWQKYVREKGAGELKKLADELKDAWGDPTKKKRVGWPLSLRVFQVS